MLKDYTHGLTEQARSGRIRTSHPYGMKSRVWFKSWAVNQNNPCLGWGCWCRENDARKTRSVLIASVIMPAEMTKMRVLELDLMNVAGDTPVVTLKRIVYHPRILKKMNKVILFIDNQLIGSGSGDWFDSGCGQYLETSGTWNFESGWCDHSRIPKTYQVHGTLVVS